MARTLPGEPGGAAKVFDEGDDASASLPDLLSTDATAPAGRPQPEDIARAALTDDGTAYFEQLRLLASGYVRRPVHCRTVRWVDDPRP